MSTSSLPSSGSRWVRLAASLLLAAAFVWLLRKAQLPMLPDRASLQHVTPWFAPVYALLMVLCIVPRTVRWAHMLKPLGEVEPRVMVGVSLLGFGIAAFAPLRMGELARPYLLSRRTPISFLQATSTAIAERVLDGLYLSLLLLAGLLLAPLRPDLPDHIGEIPLRVAEIPRAAYGALAVFACAFAALGLFYWARELALRLTRSTVGAVSPRMADFLNDTLSRLADGLRFLTSGHHTLPLLRDTALYWIVCVVMAWAALHGCGLDVSLPQACVVLGITGLGILIPSGPAFFGTYQLAIFCSLALFFPEEIFRTRGVAYVFLTYILQHTINLLALLVGVWLLRTPQPKAP